MTSSSTSPQVMHRVLLRHK